jgi:hypothetical protein
MGGLFTPIRNTSASWRTIAQLEQRIRTRGQALIELLTEPGQLPQRTSRAGVMHTDHRSPWSIFLCRKKE